MTRISNDTGRAFEILITETLIKYLQSKNIKFSLTQRAKKDNDRDKKYFEMLSKPLQEDFIKAGNAAVRWVENQGWFKSAKNVIIDRLPDTEGVKGNVTDLQISIESEKGLSIKNISLKHHHSALKHPRLPRLPAQCGITDPKIKSEWSETHKKIWEDFYKEARKLDKSTTEFSSLKAIDHSFIDKHLYEPLIKAVISFLEKYANNPQNISKFFKFLTSEFDFFTIKNEPNRILIKKFVNITQPKGFTSEYPYKGRLTTFLMIFDNGWDISLRLHTASSEFYRNNKVQMSTKFDVLCENLDEVIGVDEELKC